MTYKAGLAAAISAIFGLAGLIVLSDQVTFDRELFATETRVMSVSEKRDGDILDQVMAQHRLQIDQSRAQYLTLRKELLAEQIERLEGKMITAAQSDYPWLTLRAQALRDRLTDIERQLEAHLLGRALPGRPGRAPDGRFPQPGRQI